MYRILMMAFALILSAGSLMWADTAHAQATRTWVSGVGDDANPCSRTAPCKTFAGAISKTAAGGEISVLDPGGFGALTITKSISIVADGAEGGVLNAASNGFTINAGVNDVVSIKGLVFEGAVSGLNGIRILSAKNVYISDTVIRGNLSATPNGCGVAIASTVNPVRVYLRNVELNRNTFGLCVTATGAVSNSAFIERSTIEGNTTNTMVLNGASVSVVVSDSILAPNAVSLAVGAVFGSTGNNRISGGVGPTTVLPLQ